VTGILNTKARRHKEGQRLAISVALAVFVLLAGCPRAGVAQTGRTVVLLCDGLTCDDLHDPALPNLAALAKNGQAALLNVATGGGPAEQAAWLAVALGYLAPAESTDIDVYPAAFGPIERANAAIVFRRRTGIVVPSPAPAPLVHLGIAPLTRRGLNDMLVGAVAAAAGRPGAITAGGLGSFRSGLFAIDSRGIGPPGDFVAPYASLLGAGSRGPEGCTFIDVGAGPDAKMRLEALLPTDGKPARRTLVVSPRSPAHDRLSLIVLAGPAVRPGLLTSATTRTPGLLANIDIAPTILSWLGVSPPASMTGHPLLSASGSFDDLIRLDRKVSLNERALGPVALLLAGIGIVTLTGGLLSVWFTPRFARLFSSIVLVLMNMPLALLLATLANPTSTGALAAVVLTLMPMLAVAEMGLSRVRPSLSPCMLVAAMTAGIVLLDAFFGQQLVKFSLLSGYQIQGIRFYGIGNEYMGILIGMLLLAVFLSEMRPAATSMLFAVTAFVIGFPRLGANAGGLVAAAVAFGCAMAALRGNRVGWRRAALWAVIGLATVFGLAILDRAMPGGYNAPSHLGGAMQAASERGYCYLLDIASRKVAMNARIVRHPAVIASFAVLAGLWWLAGGQMKRRFDDLCSNRPSWAKGLPAAGWGALAAFLFNDSGIVAALFILGAFAASGLHFLFADSVPVEPAPEIHLPESAPLTS